MPAAGENVGVASVPVAFAVTVAAALLLLESVAVSVAVLIPVRVGVKLIDVANEAPPDCVEAQVPVVAAAKAAGLVPVAAKVTIGPEPQAESFKIVVKGVVEEAPTAAVAAVSPLEAM